MGQDFDAQSPRIDQRFLVQNHPMTHGGHGYVSLLWSIGIPLYRIHPYTYTQCIQVWSSDPGCPRTPRRRMPGLTKLISILYGVTAAGDPHLRRCQRLLSTFCGFGNISLAHHISLRIIRVFFYSKNHIYVIFMYTDLDLEMCFW